MAANSYFQASWKSGAQYCAPLDLAGFRPVSFGFGSTVFGDSIIFKVSCDRKNYLPLYDQDGNRVSVKIGALRRVTMPPWFLYNSGQYQIAFATASTGVEVSPNQDVSCDVICDGF